MKKAASAEEFYASADNWKAELAELRKVLLTTGLVEEIKWGAPCYTLDGANIVSVADFKNHFALWFHQGGLLRDEAGLLVNAQEGVTKAQRQWRMTSKADIKPAIIKAYVKEAVANAKAGKRIAADRDKPIIVPDELAKALKADKAAGKAFEAMSKACRREYAEYVSDAKQDATKQRRLEKILPMIRAGGGLNDRYKQER